MSEFSESDWVEFGELVENLGTLYHESSQLIFRGTSKPVDRSTVMAPFNDANTISNLLKANPTLLTDAGFHTILPVAKSVEMHVRLLYFGSVYSRFNQSLSVYKALKSIDEWIKGNTDGNPMHEGKPGTEVEAGGEFFEQFKINVQAKREQWDDLLKHGQSVYKSGNKYRHNQVKTWEEVEKNYVKQVKSFKAFKELFDDLTK